MTTRRNLLMTAGSAFSLVSLLAACSTKTPTSPAPLISPQIIQTMNSIVVEAGVIVSTINQVKPNTISAAILNDITLAQKTAASLIAQLSTATAPTTGANLIQTIFNYINTIMTDVQPALQAASGAYPALIPAVDAFDLIVPLLPMIEAWLASTISTTVKSAAVAPMKPIAVTYTASQALSVIAAMNPSVVH